MRMRSFFKGILRMELTSADPEMLLQHLLASGIELTDICRISDLTVSFSVSRTHYSALIQLCKKHGAKAKILYRSGIYWIGKAGVHRPILILGLIFVLVFCLSLPTRVLFVNVKGNAYTPTRKILDAAQESGIRFGASRRDVRSEKVKNALLSSLPELEWVGVNTAGCVAEISVRERTEFDKTEPQHTVSHIIAARDGYILSMTVTSGNPLCAPGQQIKKGQTLVSGYTDCGIFIHATHSEAEVFAQTNHTLELKAPTQGRIRLKERGRTKKISLLIGKKRINLWKGSGIPDSSCGRIYKEKYAALPGGFQLPLALCVDEFIFYDTKPANVTFQTDLSFHAQKYLNQHMTAGTILSKEEQFTREHGIIRLEGNYTCQEMIGRVKQEQIGDTHG